MSIETYEEAQASIEWNLADIRKERKKIEDEIAALQVQIERAKIRKAFWAGAYFACLLLNTVQLTYIIIKTWS